MRADRCAWADIVRRAVCSTLDDEFFSITHCGNYAVFSKQVNVHNTDLFRISMKSLFGQENTPAKNESNTTTKGSLASL